MANRYWVGGTANWDGTAGTKWALTSGGTGGEAVPTSADDVFFDGSSGANTVTIAAGNTGAKSITCTGFTGTLAGSSAITISGNVTFVAGMTLTYSGVLTINATSTIISAGKSLGSLNVSGSGITLTLGDALTLSSDLTITQGTFTTSNFNVTCQNLISSNSNTRTVNLGSSTISIGAQSQSAVNIGTTTNLTFNAGTSQINLTNASYSGIFAPGLTFYNVSFTGVTTAGSVSSSITASVFNNLTLISPTSAGTNSYSIASCTINGTLNCSGSSPSRRCYINTFGGTTLTVATLSATDCDFGNVTLSGAASGSAPTRAGNAGGNTNITFPASKNVYRVGTDTTWAGSSSWATSSGGTGNDNNFPLPQDVAYFDNSTTGTSITLIRTNSGGIDFSSRTNAYTFTPASSNIFGDFKLSSSVTISGGSTAILSFVKFSGVQSFDSAGKTIPFQINITSSFKLLGNLTANTYNGSSVVLSSNTFDANNFNVTLKSFFTSGTVTVAFGSGTWTLDGNGNLFQITGTSSTVTGSAIINCTYSGSVACSVDCRTNEANSVSYNFTAGTYTLSCLQNASQTVKNLDFTGFAGTLASTSTAIVYGNFKLSTGMTLSSSTNALRFGATSGTQNITTNGKTIDFPINFNGSGGTFKLLDAFTMGSSRTCTHTNGTLDLNGNTLTVGGSYTTATGTKNLTFNGGTLVCPAVTSVAFNNVQSANFTTTAGTGTGKISMTGATSKTFVGGSRTYNCTLSNDGAGSLTITGGNTFTALANGVQPTTFSFTAGTTTTVTNWNISGTVGNLVTIGSSTAASHTLSKPSGIVSSDYLSISRSTATGGATWYAGANSTDGGNNSGWIFTAPVSAGFFTLLFN